jgi:predicted ATP pyrophosphatase (TIGR00289 family)
LDRAKSEYSIQGVVHGGIKSDFQRRIFAQACAAYGLEVLSPLWHIEPRNYLHELILRYGFEIIVVSVSAMGLDDSWLGRRLDVDSIKDLERLSSKFGFNLTFEGGEAETIVTDCPLFISKKLDIRKSKKSWDGQRGIFEILEAALVNKAEGGEGTTVVV